MEKQNQTKKLPGFYIALCCCVIAIGVAGFFAQNTQTEPTTVVTEVTETPQETETEIAVAEEVLSETQTIVIEPQTTPETEEEIIPSQPLSEPVSYTEDFTFDNPDITPVSVSVQAEESTIFNKPVNGGTLLEGFSGDNLVYNEKYNDWRSHSGADYSCPVGTEVCAAAGGKVISVSNGSYGKQITIEHPDGFKTVYAQLDEIRTAEGEEVAQGTVIATTGESIGENVTAPHLHFEILKDGKPENPEEY